MSILPFVDKVNARKAQGLLNLFWPIVIGITFVMLVAMSWRKWPDILVDYGMQLYVPWQLVSGKVLQKDIAYITGGPFSQYLNASLFKLFGVSMTVLVVANLCAVMALLALIYSLFLKSADRWTAGVTTLVTLCVFSFAQYIRVGNYNFICAYSYESFHGLVLSVAAIACLCQWIATRRKAYILVAGLSAGCVFLTKPEIFIAVAAALGAGCFVERSGPPPRMRPLPWRAYGWLLLGFAMPSAVFMIYFTSVWDFRGGIEIILGSWLPLVTTGVAKNPLYEWCLGLDTPRAHIFSAAWHFGGFLLVILLVGLFAACFCRRQMVGCVVSGLVLIGLMYSAWKDFYWPGSGYALAPVTFFGIVFFGCKWWRNRRSSENVSLVFPLVWGVFSFILLAKMGFYTRIFHYGFTLALPSTVFVIFCVIKLLPCELHRFRVHTVAFRLLATVFIGIGMVRLVEQSNWYYSKKDFPVGAGGDQIFTYGPKLEPIGDAVQQAVSWIRDNTTPSNTVAVLPEGAIINYLTRRMNPTRYALFTPSEVQAFGESNMVDDFNQHRPDYIVIAHRASLEWNVSYFGLQHGYGYDLMQWVRENYSPVWIIGNEPLQTNRFGIKMFKRNEL